MPAGPLKAGRRVGLCCACLLLAGSAKPGGRLTSEAFIWQVRWPAAVSQAVAGDNDLFATWHVLAADLPEDGAPVPAQADWTAVNHSGHRAVPVVRIEGRLAKPRIEKAVAAVLAVLAGLPSGVARAVEIDHDAATAQLADYAAFLRALRTALPPGTTVSATALPTWLTAAAFSQVANAVDLLVLQVHAVDDPRLGLFGPARALAAVHALAWRTATPFLVSLPAYGVRVTEDGATLRVASEAPMPDGRAGGEVAADPGAVASFLATLRQEAPIGLRGIVWFRLPVAGDTRAWSEATLRHVVLGQTLERRMRIGARPGQVPGVSDIVVRNDGADDAPLPRRIALPPGCLAADGVAQYGIDGSTLALRGAGLLHARAAVLAGWMRCDTQSLHAQD